MTGRELSDELRAGDPSIVAPYEASYIIMDYSGKLTINPEFMLEGDEQLITRRIREILTRA